MAQLLDYLKQAVEDNASDLFIVTGSPVCEKRDTRVTPGEQCSRSAARECFEQMMEENRSRLP